MWIQLRQWKRLIITKFAISFVFLASGCRMTPPPPILREPPAEVLDLAKEKALAEASYISDGWLAQDWWRLFNDPQLDELISRALEENPSIDAAEARIKKAIAFRYEVAAPSFPKLGFQADVVRVHESPNSIFGILHKANPAYPITYWQKDLTITFSYTFDFFSKFRNQIIAALDEVQALKAEAYTAQLSLAISVSQFYFQLHIDRARLDLAQKLVENRQAIADLMIQRQKQKLENGSSVNRALNNVLNAEQYQAQMSQGVATSWNELQALIAEDFNSPIPPMEVTGCLSPFPLPCSLPLDLVAHRPDVWANRWRVEGAARQISVAEADFYPNIDIKGFIGLQALNELPLNTWDSVAGLVTPALHLPLFNGGQLRSAYESRIQEYLLAVADYDSSVLTAAKEVLNAVVILQMADENYEGTIETEELAIRNVELSRLQLQQKLNSRIDLLSYENERLQAADARLQAFQNSLQARLDLIRALGGGYGICEDMYD